MAENAPQTETQDAKSAAPQPPKGASTQKPRKASPNKIERSGAPEESKVKAAPVMPNAVSFAEHSLQHHLVYVNPVTTDADLENEDFWVHVANQFRAPALLTIMAEDGSWKKNATVLFAENTFATVRVDQTFQYEKVSIEADDPDMKPEWVGMREQWRVIRRRDGAVISSGHRTQALAREWIRQRRKAGER